MEKLMLADIISELERINKSVFQLKEFAKQIINMAEKGTFEDIQTVIKIYKPKEILDQLNSSD